MGKGEIMNKCQHCNKKFETIELINSVDGLSDYPVKVKADYCPFCGRGLGSVDDAANYFLH